MAHLATAIDERDTSSSFSRARLRPMMDVSQHSAPSSAIGTESPFFPKIQANKQATRPEAFPYRLGGLLQFPRRLLGTSACEGCNLEIGHAGEKEDMVQDTELKVGQPRTLKKTAFNRVQLKQVLENRFLPPLTRDEFTNYLRYEERSSENYFFFAWLEGYRKQYSEWLTERNRALDLAHPANDQAPTIVDSSNYDAYIAMHRGGQAGGGVLVSTFKTVNTEKKPHAPPKLHEVPLHVRQSFELAMRTFFRSDSHLQLNLNEEVLRKLQMDSLISVDSKIFDAANEAVEQMLNDSLNRYLREVSGNAGRYRSAFAVFLGIFVVLAAFAPFFLALWYHWHRAIRLVCLPIIFFGTLTAIGGLRRTCIVIFFFGTARQLRMCELEKPLAPKVKRPEKSQYEEGLQESASAGMEKRISGASTQQGDAMNAKEVESKIDEQILPVLPTLPEPVMISLTDPSDLAGTVNILGLTSVPSEAGQAADSPVSTKFEEKSGMFGSASAGIEQSRSRAMTSGTGTATFVNPWDTASLDSEETLGRTSKSSPIFAPLTRVFAPQIIRQQRDAILRGAKYGAVVSILLGAIILAVPNISH